MKEGRVEFCSNDTWYSICADNWENREAVVICSSLGFSTDLGVVRFLQTMIVCVNNYNIFLFGVVFQYQLCIILEGERIFCLSIFSVVVMKDIYLTVTPPVLMAQLDVCKWLGLSVKVSVHMT